MATKNNIPTQQKPAAPKLSKEMIQQMLSQLSVEELEQFRLEKLAASLEPLKVEYMELTAKLKSTLDSILVIDPSWEAPKPDTLAQRILSFVTESDHDVTKAEICAAVGSKLVFSAMKKLLEKDKTMVKKGDKYAAVKAE